MLLVMSQTFMIGQVTFFLVAPSNYGLAVTYQCPKWENHSQHSDTDGLEARPSVSIWKHIMLCPSKKEIGR